MPMVGIVSCEVTASATGISFDLLFVPQRFEGQDFRKSQSSCANLRTPASS
jgi:hypothetical protein